MAVIGADAARPQPRPLRRRHRLDRQDVDEGHPRCTLLRRSRAPSRPRAATTPSSACRSRSAGSSRRPRSASSRWACAASARSPSSARSRGPDVGVITAVGPVHLELVGSVDGVARSKAELVAALPPRRDRRRADVGRPRTAPPRTTSRSCASAPVDVELRDDGAHVAFGERRDPLPAHLAPPGAERAHRADGLRGAGPAARPARGGRGAVQLSPWRGEELPLPGGGFVVNDAYNANPTSMEAALRHLAERGAGRRRVAILGGMAELGDHTERHHREIAELADELEIEVLAVGDARARLRRRRVGAAMRPRRSRRRGSSSSPATPCSSRRPVPLPSKASPRPWRTTRRNGPSLHRRPDRDGRLRRDRAEVHRVPAPERARPADPRGRPRRSRRQAGDTGDGGLADPALRAVPFLALSKFTLPALTVLFLTVSLRRDRLSRRLHQAPPPPLARAPGPVEAPPARRDHGRRRASPSTRRSSSTPRSTSRS